MVSHYVFYIRKMIAQLYLNLACSDAAGVPADQSGKCVGRERVLEQRFLPLGPARKQGAVGTTRGRPKSQRAFLRRVPSAPSRPTVVDRRQGSLGRGGT